MNGHWTSLSRQKFLLQRGLPVARESGDMEAGWEAELEDTKEGKVKGLVPAQSQNWQEI